MREKFSIRLISINEIKEVTNWATLEGFSPGVDDVSIFFGCIQELSFFFISEISSFTKRISESPSISDLPRSTTVSYTHLTLPTICSV